MLRLPPKGFPPGLLVFDVGLLPNRFGPELAAFPNKEVPVCWLLLLLLLPKRPPVGCCCCWLFGVLPNKPAVVLVVALLPKRPPGFCWLFWPNPPPPKAGAVVDWFWFCVLAPKPPKGFDAGCCC